MAQAAGGTGGARGSATVTLHLADHGAASASSSPPVQPREEVLSLRLPRRRTKKVAWIEGTVDNEFLNKKSSKKCCVFHKEHGFDSDDSDDDGVSADRGMEGEGCDGHGHSHGLGCNGEGSSRNPNSGGGAGCPSTSGTQLQL